MVERVAKAGVCHRRQVFKLGLKQNLSAFTRHIRSFVSLVDAIEKILVLDKQPIYLQWIDWLVVQSDFIMQIIAGYHAGRSDIADGIAS